VIIQAYEQREKLTALGMAARQLAEQRADWRRNFTKLLEAYQLALQLRSHSPTRVTR